MVIAIVEPVQLSSPRERDGLADLRESDWSEKRDRIGRFPLAAVTRPRCLVPPVRRKRFKELANGGKYYAMVSPPRRPSYSSLPP